MFFVSQPSHIRSTLWTKGTLVYLAHVDSGFVGRCRGNFSVPNFLSKELSEVFSQDGGRASLDNLSKLGREADAAETREASHSSEEHILKTTLRRMRTPKKNKI